MDAEAPPLQSLHTTRIKHAVAPPRRRAAVDVPPAGWTLHMLYKVGQTGSSLMRPEMNLLTAANQATAFHKHASWLSVWVLSRITYG